MPSYLGRFEVACQVRKQCNCASKKHPSEYLKSQILVDTIVASEEGIRHLVAEVGAGSVVFGTDEPFTWPTSVDMILNAPFLSDAGEGINPWREPGQAASDFDRTEFFKKPVSPNPHNE